MPLRRMILQLRQMRLTDASTFIFQLLVFGFWRSQPIARCFLRRDLYLARKVMRAFDRSYGVSCTVTLSPGRMRM